MLDHDFKRVGTSLFAQGCPNGYVSPDDHLKSRTDGGENVSRPDNNAADNSEVLRDAKIWELKGRSHHLMRNRVAGRTNVVRHSLVQGITVHMLFLWWLSSIRRSYFFSGDLLRAFRSEGIHR